MSTLTAGSPFCYLCLLDLPRTLASTVTMGPRMRLTVHISQLKLGLLRRLGGFEPDASDAGLACG